MPKSKKLTPVPLCHPYQGDLRWRITPRHPAVATKRAEARSPRCRNRCTQIPVSSFDGRCPICVVVSEARQGVIMGACKLRRGLFAIMLSAIGSLLLNSAHAGKPAKDSTAASYLDASFVGVDSIISDFRERQRIRHSRRQPLLRLACSYGSCPARSSILMVTGSWRSRWLTAACRRSIRRQCNLGLTGILMCRCPLDEVNESCTDYLLTLTFPCSKDGVLRWCASLSTHSICTSPTTFS